MSSTLTLAAEAHLQQDIKKSRFLAQAGSVDEVDAALAFVARVSSREATHNCWAYKIGASYRFNDDGEPGGSAGRPILAAIEGQGLDHVVVVVTRWFGGVKLGVGGLVRAYGGCAAECLRRAPKRTRIERRRLRVRCDFAAAAALHARLRDFEAIKHAERADADGVEFELDVPDEHAAALAAFLRDLTRGRAVIDSPA
ncbi:MAG TPA: YigZ family protein [Dokdonella sp.]